MAQQFCPVHGIRLDAEVGERVPCPKCRQPETPQCRHHNDADKCMTCGTKPAPKPVSKAVGRPSVGDGWGRGDVQHEHGSLTAEESAAILGEQIYRQFGLTPPRPIEERIKDRADTKPRSVFNGLREALRLDRQDIVDLFDHVVYENVRFTEVETSVANDVLERRITKLKKIVQRSKELIESWSVNVMKIRRAEDNMLDKATREKFKRDENARIARCNVKLAKYRTASRNGGYKEKIWQYALVPTYFHDILDDNMIFESGVYNLNYYRRVLQLGPDALQILGETESEQLATWAGWRKWEDAVITTAIRCNVLRVNPELASTLDLMGVKLELVPDDIEADTTEDALAIKTGGACYGGRIKGGGVRFRNGRFRQRALESFDKGAPLKDGGMAWESNNDPTTDSTSDDYESQAL